MKTLKILILSLFMATAAINFNQVKAQVAVSADITFNVFHNGLSPYGRWVNHPTHGQVWISNERDFVPYRTNGHWAYTEDGWTWVSNYSWGWAPFHYGRWDYEASIGGYYWVPDYQWGPAWVSWRRDNTNYGWAPLRPGINVGIGISFGADIAAERWTFVPNRYITSPYVNRHYIDYRRNVTIIRNTTIINNVHNNRNSVVVIGGPQRTEVERVTRTRVHTYAINNSTRPGTRVERNTINIYRPVVNKTTVVNKEVVNKNKTVINNNQKTVVNNNSNNKTTVNNKNSNNKTTVNNKNTVNSNNKKVDNKTTVNNNQKKVDVNNKSTVNNKKVDNSKKSTVNNKKAEVNKSTVNNEKKTVNNNDKTTVKKQAPARKPSVAKKPAQQQKPKQQNPDNKKPE